MKTFDQYKHLALDRAGFYSEDMLTQDSLTFKLFYAAGLPEEMMLELVDQKDWRANHGRYKAGWIIVFGEEGELHLIHNDVQLVSTVFSQRGTTWRGMAYEHWTRQAYEAANFELWTDAKKASNPIGEWYAVSSRGGTPFYAQLPATLRRKLTQPEQDRRTSRLLEQALQRGEGFTEEPEIIHWEFRGFSDSLDPMFQVSVADEYEKNTDGMIYVSKNKNGELEARF